MRPRRDPILLARILPTAVLAAAVSAWQSAGAQSLGRLFSTPQERARLDEIRRTLGHADTPTERAAGTAPAHTGAPAVSRLAVQGAILGGRGRGSVWVNGQRVSSRGGVTREGLVVEARRAAGVRVEISLPSGVSVQLAPGQRLDLASGTVLEPYQVGSASAGAGAFALGASPSASSAGDPDESIAEAGRNAKKLETVSGGHPGG